MTDPTPDEVPAITVVVCTYNRAALLPVSLDALGKQSIQSQMQIIVVDDGSSDTTSEVVQRCGVEYLPLGANQGLSAARNAGIARARSEIIAFTDDDVAVPHDWAERIVAAWRELGPEVSAFGGEVTVANPSSFVQHYLVAHNPLTPIELDVATGAGFVDRLRSYLRAGSGRQDTRRPVFSLVGANMSFRKSALAAIGNFDPTIRFGGDELKVCAGLREHFGEHTVVCDSSLKVAHLFDPGLRDTLRRAYGYGKGNGRSFARDGGILSVRPASALSLVLCGLLLPFDLGLGLLAGAVVPFAIWRKWVLEARREHDAAKLAYPLLALLQEHVNNVGLLVGWRQERKRLKRVQ